MTAAFSPDGSRIITASADNTVRLWDAASWVALATLAGHTGGVVSAAFSPDGLRIVTASVDRTARICRLDPIVLMPADQRRAFVCRERLIGAQSFSEREMQDPMLRGRDGLRDPRHRNGPFSLGYYRRAAGDAMAAVRRVLSH